MIREVLKIMTPNPEGEDGYFLEEDNPEGIALTEYNYTASRMGMPTLTATLMYEKCLDELWTGQEYVILRGERYYIRNTPTSSKDNDDVRYKHDLSFQSERAILNDVYFYDTVTGTADALTKDRPCSNSTTVKFYGKLHEFVDRLNCALNYAGIGDSILKQKTHLTTNDIVNGDGYCAMVDAAGNYDHDANFNFEFTDQYISEVLSSAYEQTEIPFEYRGRKIIFGATEKVVDRVFKYGADNELLSVTKTNANAKVINRITFLGGTENIPYYYPNESEYGHLTALVSDSSSIKGATVEIINQRSLLAYSRPNTPIQLTKIVQRWVDNVEINDLEYELNDSISTRAPFKFGEWVDQTCNTLTIYIGIKCTEAGNYAISALNGDIWNQGDAKPAGSRNLFATYHDGIKATIRESNDPTKKERILSIDNQHRLILGELLNYDYEIAITISNSQRSFEHFKIDNIPFEKKTITEYKWVCGDTQFDSLTDYGLRLHSVVPANEGDWVYWTTSDWMPFQENLMPPKYRKSLGTERFYNAVNYDKASAPDEYIDPDTKLPYVFPNPYVAGHPSEYIYRNEKIKPTIEGIVNSQNIPFGSILEIAYDKDDSDALIADTEETERKYEHSFFYIRIPKFDGQYGFNLLKHAIQDDAMTIQMTSGPCNGCKFKVQVLEKMVDGEEVWYNPVQATQNGEIYNGNYEDKVKDDNIQEWQQNTETHSIWLCVQKDTETFGVIMPNRENKYLPNVNDTFNIINIELPDEYKEAAEKRGEQEMMRFMHDNNEQKFTFGINFSRVFFAENLDVFANLDEYSKIVVEYNERRYELYISSFTLDCKDADAIPEISVSLSDTISVGSNFIEAVSERALSLIANAYTLGGALGTGGGINFVLADRRYLSKQKSDRTPYRLSTDSSFEVGSYLAGSSGGIFSIDPETGDTFIEADKLHIRKTASFQNLQIVNVSSIGGETMTTPGGGVEISFVETIYDKDDASVITGYRCYFKVSEDDQKFTCRFVVGDQAICQAWINGTNTAHYYWRLVTEVNNDEGYVVLSSNVCDANSDVPLPGDTIVQLGNRAIPELEVEEDKSRQTAIVVSTVSHSAPQITLYDNINTFSLSNKDQIGMGVDHDNGKVMPYFKCYGSFHVGPKDGSTYINYDPTSKKITIKADIVAESTVGDKPFGEYINELVDLSKFQYLADALGDFTQISGGLILTSNIALGQTENDEWLIYSGINGKVLPEKGMTSLATWFGGNPVDLADYYEWDDVTREWVLKEGVTQAEADAARIAQGADRMDGSGYRAGGSLWWDTSGNVHADPLSFFVGENYIGLSLALFQIVPNSATELSDVDYVIPQKPFQKLALGEKTDTATLTYEIGKKLLKIDKGLYSTGDITAFGEPSASSSGGGSSYNRLDNWSEYSASKDTWVLSAKLGWDLNTRVNLLAAQLKDFQPLGNYLTKAVADTYYQPKGNYVTTSALSSYLTKTDAADLYQPKGSYATAADLAKYLPLTGGTLTGNVTWSSDTTERKTYIGAGLMQLIGDWSSLTFQNSNGDIIRMETNANGDRLNFSHKTADSTTFDNNFSINSGSFTAWTSFILGDAAVIQQGGATLKYDKSLGVWITDRPIVSKSDIIAFHL